MKKSLYSLFFVSFVALVFCMTAFSAAQAADEANVAGAAVQKTAEVVKTPSHQVYACYFHRTNRCDTCKKISANIEESIKSGFAEELKSNAVKVLMIDFQDEKNAEYTKAYKITGPTLVLMNVRDGKVMAWKPAPKVWSLVGDKEKFAKYVQDEMKKNIEAK